jgi:hypothetical protein
MYAFGIARADQVEELVARPLNALLSAVWPHGCVPRLVSNLRLSSGRVFGPFGGVRLILHVAGNAKAFRKGLNRVRLVGLGVR